MNPAPAHERGWLPVQARFYAGGKAEETPREVWWRGAWRSARLLGEELNAPAGGDCEPWRCFRLELAGGQRIILRGIRGQWQAKAA